jgi:hypothetical protein
LEILARLKAFPLAENVIFGSPARGCAIFAGLGKNKTTYGMGKPVPCDYNYGEQRNRRVEIGSFAPYCGKIGA